MHELSGLRLWCFFLETQVNLNIVFYNIAYLVTFFEKFGMDSLANYFFIGFEINFMISPGFILPEKDVVRTQIRQCYPPEACTQFSCVSPVCC